MKAKLDSVEKFNDTGAETVQIGGSSTHPPHNFQDPDNESNDRDQMVLL